MSTATPIKRRRGRPRSERARAAILSSARELLLEHGLDPISMDAVAARAHASKATIYRWWPSKELLALDALFGDWTVPADSRRATATLTGDLLGVLLPWARELRARPYVRVIAGLVAKAQTDAEFAETYRARFVRPCREQATSILAAAIARGELPPDADVELTLDLLYGAIYHRMLHSHRRLDDEFVRALVTSVVTAARAPRIRTDQSHLSSCGG